ncbi:helix-turn-helix domain-containing protein [Tunicatimonas pelagia]|uniref:helix-turn-helix domain-containing protein n=1 Tax=Tunicatimonas pelagia TaxID=931531 RepID=UPI0026669222|nr:AraC family transcriptional regulator [Tunicatimonas pelagia]WKN42761.1 AraC family transcriptional regulator [Tunicatimonas pelagia]
MDELGKISLVEEIYKHPSQVPIHRNPVLLVITYFDIDQGTQQSFCFRFRYDHHPRSKPLLLGTENGSCGEYFCQPGQPLVFKELGCLTDTLSCLISIHLVRELRANGHADVNHVHHMAISLMSYLMKKYRDFKLQGQQNQTGGIAPFRLRKIEEYVLSHISSPVSIAELAEIAGTSVYYFVRTFRQSTGETPHQFIARHKMNRAKELLTQTNMKIIQIGLEVGYDDPGHFARVFKRHLGITPSGFRKILQT